MNPSPASADAQRARLWSLLGRLPQLRTPVQSTVVRRWETDRYLGEEFTLDLNGIEAVPAYFLRPVGAPEPYPVVVFQHSHGGRYTVGKEELLIGAPYMASPAYADDLTTRGWAVLAIDSWNFGARHRTSESALFKEMLWKGQVLWGMMAFDAFRSVDYLHTRRDVDPSRIATVGMSMGSTLCWWLAALDPRVKVCAEICCLTDFHSLLEEQGLDRHGLYYYVPDLLNHFETAEINALIAPRPHLSVVGMRDPLTPSRGVEKIGRALEDVYSSLGALEAWKLLQYDCEHLETLEMRREVLQWLHRWL